MVDVESLCLANIVEELAEEGPFDENENTYEERRNEFTR